MKRNVLSLFSLYCHLFVPLKDTNVYYPDPHSRKSLLTTWLGMLSAPSGFTSAAENTLAQGYTLPTVALIQ